MTITISKKVFTPILTLVIGFALGITGTVPSNAEDPVPVVQGEILKVCINLKTGVIRVSNKCDVKTERKTVLGGVGAQGAQGAQGETGATGSQGPQGYTGATGATGSTANLRTKEIQVWEESYGSLCSSLIGYFSVLNSNTSLSTFGSTISLNKRCSTLTSSSVTVYAP